MHWEVAQILFPLPPDDENKELEGVRRSNAVASVMQEEEDKGIVKMHNRINDFVTEGIDDYHRKVYDGESRLYKFAFIIAVQGVSIRDVDKTMNIIKSKLDSKRILHETPRYGMVDVFKSMMPTPFVVERILDTILGDTAAKMCPLRNLNPRLANSGRFIGMNDKTKNSIFIKFDGGNEDVVSGHSLVIGKSGSGKSTELLKDDIRAVADGYDALHIVPKDDDTTNHVRACKAMDGQLIKIGHGGTNFNMLQVFFDPSRMEDSKDSYQKAYSEHVFTMTTCLGLLVGDGFSDAQKNWLYSSLATLYERFRVVDSKGDVINTDQWQDGMFWPNLEDLRGIWDKWLQDGDHKAGSMPIGALYNNTAMLTEKGPLGFLVNHNSLKLNNPFIVVDISALSTVPNVQDAMTLLIMNIVNTKLACAKKGEKKKRIFITLDESANLVKNSRMKNGIEKLYREGRSRGACIKLVSQDLSGYDRSTIDMLKANSDYILLLSNMRSDNVKPLISEFNLNDDDINRLLEKGKGIGLFIIGSTHLYYRNTLSDFEKEIMVTIQPPPNQLANIDFDVIGTSDY